MDHPSFVIGLSSKLEGMDQVVGDSPETEFLLTFE